MHNNALVGYTPTLLLKKLSVRRILSFCLFLSLVGMFGSTLWSCSSDDDSKSATTLTGNALAYDNATSPIASVVYTVDETQKIYTFYFSPTQGLIDLDAMLLADDYIQIVTTIPTGAIDLLKASNRLVYKKIDVSSATEDNVATASLSLQLTSVTTAKMTLDIVTKTGETLKALYNGTCIRSGAQQIEGYDVTLDRVIFGYYGGQSSAGTNRYYVALTNTTWEGTGTSFSLAAEGYALVLDFYGTPGETWRDMPTGSFTESAKLADHTFFGDQSAVAYYNGSTTQALKLADPVKVERDAEGITTITATFLDKNYNEQTLIYKGALKLTNGTLNVNLPQVDDDVYIDGAYASGIYEGDIYDNGSGCTEITIYDKDSEAGAEHSYAMKITLFSTKFIDPLRERKLVAGTYRAATSGAQFTWMPAVEVNFYGIIFPMGTYALYADGTETGQYSYASTGDIVIRENGKNLYTIEFDIQSLDGHTIRGSFTGDCYLTDESDDDENDGTSTLTGDYTMDMSPVKRADCYQPETIWVRGLDDITIAAACERSGVDYGFQRIMIGTSAGIWEYTDEYPAEKGKGKLIPTDIIGIDLLVAPGTETQITPGTYAVTANRYPGYFRPGVCVCGYNCYYGTSFQHITSALGWGYPEGYYDPTYMVENGWLNMQTADQFASIYAGSVTVSKATGGDNWFTFELEGKDVMKHTVTGSWTGPVYLHGTETPVVQSPEVQSASAHSASNLVTKTNAPLLREVVSSGVSYERFYFNPQSYK